MKLISLFLGLAFLGSVAQASSLEAEKKESQAFLDKEAKVAKTEKTASGLLYRETKAGTGVAPSASETVIVEYKGTLRDGKVFDASNGKPATFPLNGVIPCWTEALQKMKPGGSAVIICPSNIAYGDSGTAAVIKGGAALKFELSLLKVVKK